MVTTLVLSQQTEPRLQFMVLGIRMEGLSQNAAIMFSKQKPGHLGAEGLKYKIGWSFVYEE